MLFFICRPKTLKKSCPPAAPKDFTSVAHLSDGIKQHSFQGILIYTENWVWKHCSGDMVLLSIWMQLSPRPRGFVPISVIYGKTFVPIISEISTEKICGNWFCVKKPNFIYIHISHNYNCGNKSSEMSSLGDLDHASISFQPEHSVPHLCSEPALSLAERWPRRSHKFHVGKGSCHNSS